MHLPLLSVILACLVCLVPAYAADDYQLGPDSQEQAGVPQGKITQHTWTSKIFEGTVRQRGKQELFHLAASSSLPTIGKEIETDLFAGVKDE